MNDLARKNVLKVGRGYLNNREFTGRSLALTQVAIGDLLNEGILNSACAVVFDLTSKKRVFNKTYLGPIFQKCAAAGLITVVFSNDPQLSMEAVMMREDFKKSLPSNARNALDRWLVIETEPSVVAEICARHTPGPSIGDVKITFLPDAKERLLDPDLRSQAEFLLRRAFNDFESITVRRLFGGKSADATFQVFANPKASNLGPQPMPFFIKMGPWNGKLSVEHDNYHRVAQPFIPFHLRPSFNRERTVEGLMFSALVSDFVDNAVPLRTALKLGNGDGVLFSLFEHTLRGMRGQTESTKAVGQTLRSYVQLRVRSHEIPGARIDEALKQGLTRLPVEIEKELVEIAERRTAKWGFYHGDLHAGNVMIRNKDAILIDFGSMGAFGPLAADPAVLEVSLLFGLDSDGTSPDSTKWKELVDRVLSSPCRPPPPAAVTQNNFETLWLEDAIRELRHVIACCGSDEVELLTVISAALLRYGRISALESGAPTLKEIDEDRHAYAIVCADRIARLAKKRDEESRNNSV